MQPSAHRDGPVFPRRGVLYPSAVDRRLRSPLRLGLLAALGLLSACATLGWPRSYSGPVFDMHAHIEPTSALGHINPKAPATVKALIAGMDEANVGEAAAIVVPDQGEQLVVAANTELAAQSAAHRGRLVPVAAIPSEDPGVALAEMERVAKAGFRAVKVTPRRDPGDLDRVGALVSRAAQLKLVVLFDGWSLDLDGLGKIALANPTAKLVIAHLGGVRFTDALVFDMLRRYAFYTRNVWFDISTVAHLYAHSPYADQLTWVCRQLGTDRILFGSDFPLLTLPEAIDDVRALGFSRDEQRQILHDNAAALFAEPAPVQQGSSARR